MFRTAFLAPLCALALLAGACRSPDYGRPLPDGWPALIPLEPGEKRPDFSGDWRRHDEVLPALDRSIEWMNKPSSPRHFPIEGVSHARALASLERFRELLLQTRSADEFDRRVAEEFTIYKSAGWNGKGGGVLFTGYYTPILAGSRTPSSKFAWPLYALPPDLEKGPDGEILGRRTPGGLEAYPTRREIEESGMLEGQGLELVWLGDPLDAFIAHVNGSAFVRLEGGEMLRFGYAGKNGRAYTSLGQELVKDKKVKARDMSLGAIRRWAAAHPDEIRKYLARNESYVFFTPIDGNPRGSLNVEVMPGRSLATDKRLFPRGSIVYVDVRLPGENGRARDFDRFLLDQDTGGAIRTAGRADIYLGIGDAAERVAGKTRSAGQLYYLFLPQRSSLRQDPAAP